MKYKGICPNCGDESETNNEHKKYCSPGCGSSYRDMKKVEEKAIKKKESEEKMRNDPRFGFCNTTKKFFMKGMRTKACDNCTCGFIPINWKQNANSK